MNLHPGAGYTFAALSLIAFLAWRLATLDRRSIAVGYSLFVTCFGLLIIASGLQSVGLLEPAGYVRGIGLFGEGLCAIYLVGLLLFRAIFPLFRLITPRIIQDVVLTVAWLVWTGIWLRANHVDLTQIVATSAVVTAVIAFSLQDTLGNVLGGISIQLDRSIQVGDWVEVDGVVGRVTEVRWRYTSLETRAWETVVMPNSYLIKNRFKVLAKREGQPRLLRRTVSISVALDHSPTRVIELIEKAFRTTRIARVAATPEPSIVFKGFTGSDAVYDVRYWLNDLSADEPADSDVRMAVYITLMRAGITPTVPQQEVLVQHVSDERRAVQEDQETSRRVEVLQRVDLFSSLTSEELHQLARVLQPAPFARSALITQQGAEADWLYVLIEGFADVVVERDGETLPVAELGPGSFFGEMGLMTGEPRTATIVARTNVQSYRLDKRSFQEVLLSRPAIAQEISEVLARRRAELEIARENLDAEAAARRLTSLRGSLLKRIHTFFNLDGGKRNGDAPR